uniref:MS113, putative Na+/glucose symporter subunit n=1 Tax=Microscilla sp. PRE1 TaxID=155537 RepID=Q93PB6_9BACT|nr:MS113, putative Na+/glucose symporter subunit [Microscilla sp. PRE1]
MPLFYGVVGLALFAAAYSLYGGLSAVAWTDVIQVVFLILGGLMTTYLALNAVSGGEGVIKGFTDVLNAAPGRFEMILVKSNDQSARDMGACRRTLGGQSLLLGF